MRKRCTVEEVILGGEAAGTILKASRDSGTDLIVMGGERKSSVFGELFSGTTEKVMQLAHAPLLIVPPAGTQE